MTAIDLIGQAIANLADLAVLVRKVTVGALTSHGTNVSIVPENPTVERPRNSEHGDYATNIVMQPGKRVGVVPRGLVTEIATALGASGGIDEAIIAGPDFTSIRLASDAQGKIVEEVLVAGEKWGHTDFNSNLDMNLEPVFANLTGLIHLGGARWAAVGDALGCVLSATSAKVTRGCYFNDHGRQIDRFSDFLAAAACNQSTPEDSYSGEYIQDAVTVVLERNLQALEGSEEKAQEHFRAIGTDMMLEYIKEPLHELGADFDVYFHENLLFESGQMEAAVNSLKESGKFYETDGVQWLRSTDCGDDEDRVIIKSNGNVAYIAGDITYVKNKFDRSHNLCICMPGVDHHSYTARPRAATATLGYNADGIKVFISQMVNLLRGGKAVRMSKRAGTVVTLDDLVESVSVDAARCSLIRFSVDSSLNTDLGLWASQSNDSLVHYVQYGRACLRSIGRRTGEAGVTSEGADFSLLVEDHEGELVRTIGEFLAIIKPTANLREPRRITRYAEQLTGVFHRFYNTCQILPKADEEVSELHRVRLDSAEATRQTLASALQLLGVTAPEYIQLNAPMKLHPTAPPG